MGTGATHGHRKGDQFEVRVDGELLATGTVVAGVAPYEGAVGEWEGALLDALAYGKTLTWGFAGQEPLISVAVPDNGAMTRALVECEAYQSINLTTSDHSVGPDTHPAMATRTPEVPMSTAEMCGS